MITRVATKFLFFFDKKIIALLSYFVDKKKKKINKNEYRKSCTHTQNIHHQHYIEVFLLLLIIEVKFDIILLRLVSGKIVWACENLQKKKN